MKGTPLFLFMKTPAVTSMERGREIWVNLSERFDATSTTSSSNMFSLVFQEFDASFGPYALTLERHGAIDFVGYIGSSTTCMLMKYPQVKISDSAIFEPYSSTVWYSSQNHLKKKNNIFCCQLWALWLCSMVFVGFTALLLVRFRSEHFTDKVKRFRRIDGMFMYLIGTMLNQGNFYLNVVNIICVMKMN